MGTVEKCKQCTWFDYTGTNACKTHATCVVCGSVTISLKQESPKLDSDLCPHDNVWAKGSTKTTRRTSCRDCSLLLCEEPQAEYRARLAMAALEGGIPKRGKVPASAMSARHAEDIHIPQSQIEPILKMVHKMAGKASLQTLHHRSKTQNAIGRYVDLVLDRSLRASSTASASNM